MKINVYILKYVLIFLVLLLLYVLIAIALSYIPVNRNLTAQKGEIPIYILTNGVHTDIVTPYSNHIWQWDQWLDLSFLHVPKTSFQWVSFGWGDKGFYLQTSKWKDLKLSVALKAALHLSESAIHVTYYDTLTLSDSCKIMYITEEQYLDLCEYIRDSFATQNQLPIVIPTNQNYGDSDVFYEAVGSYSIFYTCNTWANNALKKAGQKACLFTLFDKGIFYHYQN